MTELIQNAINKIDSEADKNGGMHAKLFASHVIDNYLASDENAQKVLDKKLDDFINEVTSKAKEQANNGCAVISDDIVYGWLVDFYGFNNRDIASVINLLDLL